MTEFLDSGPMDAAARLLLAHGAGGAMTSSFLEIMAELLAERNIAVTRFEFAYMAARRNGGKRRPPPKAELLVPEYREAVEQARSKSSREQMLLIGGKSMGGRVASLLADELFAADHISGLVCLGYPFHPPGKPDQLRTQHLTGLTTPALFVQGERDPFGSRPELEQLSLSPHIRFHWASDGDHDLGPRGGSGFTRRGNLASAADAVAAFATSLTRPGS
jgi:predicted alpha/beta-hydrolase family hydrolase